MNKYDSFFVESEAMLGITNDDPEYVDLLIASLGYGERRTMRLQVLELYAKLAKSEESLEEILGELQRIADDTAPIAW